MHKEIRGELDFIDEIVVVGDRQADTNGWDEVVELGRQSGIEETTLDLLTSDCNEVSEIIFTSGTTGQPKGVLHTINTLAAGVQGILPNFTKGSEEVVHMGSTFAHQTGFLFGARLPLMVCGTGVYQDVWDPVVFADLIESRGITASAGAAPFLADLLGVPGLEDRNLSSFTMFGCFGSAIPLPLLEDAAERLPCAVMPGWGMSEISLMTTTTLTDSIDKISGTDGAPLKGNKIRVVDESGRTLT
jgi:cyclohexanecarboxylate-CoA ligase